MKTKEFIKKVEGMDYEIQESDWVIEVWDNYKREKCVSIAKYSDKSVYISTNNYSLIKFCMEYAETPIEERGDVKKYSVEIPDIENLSPDRVYALARTTEEKIMINRTKREHFIQNNRYHLTEAEIKRNHSYLWQFAKEVN